MDDVEASGHLLPGHHAKERKMKIINFFSLIKNSNFDYYSSKQEEH